MDACYADDDDDGTAANAFQMEMSKLWNILRDFSKTYCKTIF